MHDALFVCGFECVRDLARYRQCFFHWNGALTDAIRERRPLNQFHDEIIGANIKERTNVGMSQGRDSARFPFESFAETLAGKLDRDLAAQPRVGGAIHLAHPANTKLAGDLVRTDVCAWAECHGSYWIMPTIVRK